MTLDWASPAAMPLFVRGLSYNNLFGDEQTENKTFGGTLADVYKSLSNITEPVFNMSMLSGIDSAIQSATYAGQGGNAVTSALIQSAANYAGQYVPYARRGNRKDNRQHPPYNHRAVKLRKPCIDNVYQQADRENPVRGAVA